MSSARPPATDGSGGEAIDTGERCSTCAHDRADHYEYRGSCCAMEMGYSGAEDCPCREFAAQLPSARADGARQRPGTTTGSRSEHHRDEVRVVSEMKYARPRRWLGCWLRLIADRVDWWGAPRAMSYSFTFEQGKGIVFHDDQRGCRMWYLGYDEYERAHDHRAPHETTKGEPSA